MAIVVKLATGDTVHLDRRLHLHDVVRQINDARTPDGTHAKLLEFQNDMTPSRATYIDPNAVVRLYDDRF